MYSHPTRYLRQNLTDLITKELDATVVLFPLKSGFVFKAPNLNGFFEEFSYQSFQQLQTP